MTKRLKDALEVDYFILRMYKQYNVDNAATQRLKRMLRRNLRSQNDQRTDSLRDHTAADLFRPDAWHTFCREDDYESRTEAIIIRDEGFDDDSLNDICEELRIDIYSPYDCTGKWFTSWLYWKRMPAGIAFVHRLSLDV